MKYAVIIPTWQRPSLLSVCLKHFDNLTADVTPVVCFTDYDDLPLANYPDHSIKRDNVLSKKYQAALTKARELDVDAVIVSADDSFFTDTYFELLDMHLARGYDHVGPRGAYILDTTSNKLTVWLGYRDKRRDEIHGPGRCLSRKLLDRANWCAWPKSRPAGCDGLAQDTLMYHTRKYKSFSADECRVVTLKSPSALTPYDRHDGVEIDEHLPLALDFLDFTTREELVAYCKKYYTDAPKGGYRNVLNNKRALVNELRGRLKGN